MDMRCAVIITVHGEVTVRVQLRRLPLPAVVFHARQGLERGSLDLLEALAARDAKATVGLVVDALDAHHQRSIDLGNRRKSGATKAEPEVAGEDFHESLCDCFIAWAPHTSRNDSRGKMSGYVRVVFVQIRIVQMAFDDAGLQAVGNGDVTDATVIFKHPPVTAEPVTAFHVLGRPGKE